jgi:hypothetical protein
MPVMCVEADIDQGETQPLSSSGFSSAFEVGSGAFSEMSQAKRGLNFARAPRVPTSILMPHRSQEISWDSAHKNPKRPQRVR